MLLMGTVGKWNCYGECLGMLKHMKAHHRQEKLNFSGLFFNRFFNLGYNFLIIFSTFFAYNFLRDTSEFFINGIGEGGEAAAADPETHLIFVSKMSHLPQTRILWESHLHNFDLSLFIVQHSKKSLQESQKNRRNSDTSILYTKSATCP